MPNEYTVQRPHSQQFVNELPFAKKSILKAGYRFWPEPGQGCFKIEKQGYDACAMCYSRYFNSATTSLLRSVRDMDSCADIREVVDYVQRSEQIFPSQQDIERAELIGRMAEEYVYIGTKARGVITPLLKRIEDDNYVKWGLLHILQRHYGGVSGLGREKASLFPQNSTINEILGAIVRAVVEGTEKESPDNRFRLTVPAEMGPVPTKGSKPHLLVLEPTDHADTFTTVTFFPNTR
jgi:hypothetical protein